MKDTTVAARYAKALFLVTERRGETERALEDLKGMVTVLAQRRVADFLASPEVRLPDKRQALRAALEGRAAPTLLVFLDLLLRKKRLAEAAVVADAFEHLVEEKQGVQRAHAVSAVALNAAELERLQQQLERATHRRIKLTHDVDARLIGGALVRIGDRVIDRSARTLLRSMERRLREANV